MSRRSALWALADAVGVARGYTDASGVQRTTRPATAQSLLAALGHEASSEARARQSLAALEAAQAESLIPPVRVARVGHTSSSISVRMPPGWRGSMSWETRLAVEGDRACTSNGSRRTRAGQASFRIPLPRRPGLGYHRLQVTLRGSGGTRRTEQLLIVVPATCPSPERVLGSRRSFGVVASLYGVRDGRKRGIGDLTTLGGLLEWTARAGGAFVGLNPLHYLRHRAGDVSPYAPVSRLFRAPLYLDPSQVPEFNGCAEAQHAVEEMTDRGRLIAYDRIAEHHSVACEALHRAFCAAHGSSTTPRSKAYRAYRERQGGLLDDFVTFLVLDERHGRGWHAWPDGVRHPRSPEVKGFREANAARTDYHRWVQFELDRQLAAVCKAGRAEHVGAMGDLALGSAGDGFDAWAFPDLFVHGVELGAPPDAYAAKGQRWGFPPIDPHRLRQSGYEYWIRLVRTNLAHLAGLRLDHVMGLFRQFWVPAGRPATEGTYMQFPGDDLVGILALECARANAFVVGEDLGTVPTELPPRLHRRGILSTRVLYFERDRRGNYRAPYAYTARALVTATTHDHPPVAGFWSGRDLELRRAAGSLASDRTLRTAMRERAAERRALLRCLRRHKLWLGDEVDDVGAFVAAVYALLSKTRAPLIGVQLEDLVGEEEPVNLPGVPAERFPSWSRRLDVPLEESGALEVARGIIAALERRRRHSP